MDVKIAGNLPNFAFDRVQIQQVLINLMRLGMQALETISGHRILGVRTFLDGGMVKVEISDTGPVSRRPR